MARHASASSPMDHLLAVLERRGCKPRMGGLRGESLCPAHEDTKASLSISSGDDGRVLIHCHAGCQPDAVVKSLDLKMSDLFGSDSKRGLKIRRVYDYTDKSGKLLFQVVRYHPKTFKQRRPDGQQWAWGLNAGWCKHKKGSLDWCPIRGATDQGKRPEGDVRWFDAYRPVLYRLPEILAAVGAGHSIYITEGEKDADAINEHPDRKEAVATTNPGGA